MNIDNKELIKQYISEFNDYKCFSDLTKIERSKQKLEHAFNGQKNIMKQLSNLAFDYLKLENCETVINLNDYAIILNAPKNENVQIEFKNEIDIKNFLNNKEIIAKHLDTYQCVNLLNTGFLNSLYTTIKKGIKDNKLLEKTQKDSPLTHDFLMSLNQSLFDNLDYSGVSGIGRYRSQYNSFKLKISGSNWEPAKASEVSDRMDALLEWYNDKNNNFHPFVKSAIFHTEFLNIHPFSDGNGRTARLIVNYELIKNGYMPILLKSCDKDAYVNAIEKSRYEHDITDFVDIIKAREQNILLKNEKRLENKLTEDKSL